MKESILTREFTEKDVNRIRNLIRGDGDLATTTSIGYESREEERKEGDIWEEDGKKWTIENGLKKSISKLQVIRNAIRVPFTCPNCNKSLNHRNDVKMYKIHKMCFDCVIDFEYELKKLGKFEQYEKMIVRGNTDIFLNDLVSMLEETLEEKNEGFVTEQGDIEKWNGLGHDKGIKQLLEKVKKIQNKNGTR